MSHFRKSGSRPHDARGAEASALSNLRRVMGREPAWCARVIGIPLLVWVRMETGVTRPATEREHINIMEALVDAWQLETLGPVAGAGAVPSIGGRHA